MPTTNTTTNSDRVTDAVRLRLAELRAAADLLDTALADLPPLVLCRAAVTVDRAARELADLTPPPTCEAKGGRRTDLACYVRTAAGILPSP